MYGRYRGDWYRPFFYFLIGLLVGQLIRIDIVFSIDQNDQNRVENVRQYGKQ